MAWREFNFSLLTEVIIQREYCEGASGFSKLEIPFSGVCEICGSHAGGCVDCPEVGIVCVLAEIRSERLSDASPIWVSSVMLIIYVLSRINEYA